MRMPTLMPTRMPMRMADADAARCGRRPMPMPMRSSDDEDERIEVDEPLMIAAWGRVVLGVNDDVDENGGVEVDFVYSRGDFTLSNGEDAFYLYSADGELISSIRYTDDWEVSSGVSNQLDGETYAIEMAEDSGYWCQSTAEMTGGDLGSPRAPNGLCDTLDRDEDGYTGADGDCDDTDPDINPSAVEAWDGIDNDCSGIVDDINEADAGILDRGCR